MRGPGLVTVRKLKFDGTVKYAWPGELFETGQPGWLGIHHDPLRDHKLMADGSIEGGEPAHLLHYCSTQLPLTVIFAFGLDGAFQDAKCDAALPAEVEGTRVDFVDLDLDVVVLPGGHHYVRDQEAFAERAISMGYSEAAKRAAHHGVLHALRLVRRRSFPFDGHPERYLEGRSSGTDSRN